MTKLIKTSNTLALGIPGVSVTKSALVISDDAPRSSLEKAGEFLGSVEGSRQWWHGDYVNALRKFRGEHYGAAEAALAMGIEETTLREAVQVSTFFPPASRCDDLSWSHHAEAYRGSNGDLAVAQGYLGKARADKLSVRDLRETIRKESDKKPAAKAEKTPAETVDTEAEAEGDPGPVQLGYGALRDANRWAREKLDGRWKPAADVAAEVLCASEDLFELLTMLRKRVVENPGAEEETPGDKAA